MSRTAQRIGCGLIAAALGTLAGCEEKPSEPTSQQPIAFADSGLEAAVREAIGKPTGDILQSDVAGLTSLDASRPRHAPGSIQSLDGLQNAKREGVWAGEETEIA